jgi:hypothetical protein
MPPASAAVAGATNLKRRDGIAAGVASPGAI